MKALTAILTGRNVIGLLGREVSVRVLDISRSGCLLESSRPLPLGTLATLSVDIEGVQYMDHVRVARCQPLSGAGNTHHVGAEFLWLSIPAESSLRLFAGELGSKPEDGTGQRTVRRA